MLMAEEDINTVFAPFRWSKHELDHDRDEDLLASQELDEDSI